MADFKTTTEFEVDLKIKNKSDIEELKRDFEEMKDDLIRAKKALRGLDGQANRTSQTGSNMTNSFKMAGAAAAIGGVAYLLKDLAMNSLDLAGTWEKYEAVLGNSLGTQAEAQKSMKMIEKIAANTPFSVNELTDSYVKLVNYGIKPTEGEITQLGDLASSVGKPFGQLAEAIADAVSGENERLKEFGITAKKAGDKSIFTFKGVKTTVDNNADSIKKYLTGLGKLKGVQHSMAKVSKTLVGQESNLGDKWEKAQRLLGGKLAPSYKKAMKAAGGLLDIYIDTIANSPTEEIYAEQTAVNKLVAELKDANTSEERRKQILEELKILAPKVVEGIDAENVSIELLTKNLKEYNKQQTASVLLKTRQMKVDEAQAKLLTAQGTGETAYQDFEDAITQDTDEIIKDIPDFQDKKNQLIAKYAGKPEEYMEQVQSLLTRERALTGFERGKYVAFRDTYVRTMKQRADALKELEKAEKDYADEKKRLEDLGLLTKSNDTAASLATGSEAAKLDSNALTAAGVTAKNVNYYINMEQLQKFEGNQVITGADDAESASDMVLSPLTRGLNDIQQR
jgi:hypothetical protein